MLIGGAGADVFVFASSGDVDMIEDFSDNFDAIDLTAFAFADAVAAMSGASQVGSDVEFDFGGGDRLIIENTTLLAVEDDLLI